MHNKQEVIGYLTKDAEIADVGNDRVVVNFRAGSTYKFKNKAGDVVEHTEWFKVKFYASDKASEFFEDRLTKGAMVYFEGRTKTEEFVGNDGVKHQDRYVECEPQNVKILSNSSGQSRNDDRKPHTDDFDDERPQRSQRSANHRAKEEATPSRSRPKPEPTDPAPAPARLHRADLMNFDA